MIMLTVFVVGGIGALALVVRVRDQRVVAQPGMGEAPLTSTQPVPILASEATPAQRSDAAATTAALAAQTQATMAALQNAQTAIASEAAALALTATAQQSVAAPTDGPAPSVTVVAVGPGPATSSGLLQPVTAPERPNPAPVGWPLQQEGLELNVVRVDIRDEANYEAAAVLLWFTLTNTSAHELMVDYDTSTVILTDAVGNQYIDWEGKETFNYRLASKQHLTLWRSYTIKPRERSRVPNNGLPLTIAFTNLGPIRDAQWQVGGTDLHSVDSTTHLGKVGEVGITTPFQVTLRDFQIRTIADDDAAAFYATFEIKNMSSQREILALNLARIFVEDDQGTRYIDWEGGGFIAFWLDAGETYSLNRYYTTQYLERSRVDDSAAQVYFVFEGFNNGQRLQWSIPARR